MKKSPLLQIATILATILISHSASASVSLKIGTSGWGNNTTSSQNNMVWGIIVSSASATFSGSTAATLQSALENFVIPAIAPTSNPVQIGSTDLYFARAQANTSASGPPAFANGFMNTALFNLVSPVTPGDAVGLLWFAEGTTTNGSHFGFQDINFIMPADSSTITSGITSTPGLASFVIGVPEPSRLLFLAFGFLGSSLVVVAKRPENHLPEKSG